MSVASAVGPFPEEDYPFVEQLPNDLMCPVMKTLLLQPHLTSCCGNHISEEAASRIHGEVGACPLCKAAQWSTVLNKHFQRQVNALRLFCHHKDRGCEWQGELSDMERHIQSCPRKDASLITIVNKKPGSQMWADMAPTWMWREGKNAPEKMARGATVVHGNTAYFRPANSTKVYSYQNIAGEKQWSQLPDNPNVNCGLAIIDGLLTSVGGDNNGPTNVLLSLTGEGERKQWLEIFPPMPTPRYGAVCINTERGLVVAGGYDDGGVDIIEIMDTDKCWRMSAENLPEGQSCLSGIIVCGNILYLGGGFKNGRPSQSLFKFSLLDVLRVRLSRRSTGSYWSEFSMLTVTQDSLASLYNCPLVIGSKKKDDSVKKKPTKMVQPRAFSETGAFRQSSFSWSQVSSLPVTQATLASFNDRLLAIGGNDDSGNATKNVYVYNEDTDSWKVVMKMRNKRSSCLTATLPGDRLIIVGGCSSQSQEADRVEILQ